MRRKMAADDANHRYDSEQLEGRVPHFLPLPVHFLTIAPANIATIASTRTVCIDILNSSLTHGFQATARPDPKYILSDLKYILSDFVSLMDFKRQPIRTRSTSCLTSCHSWISSGSPSGSWKNVIFSPKYPNSKKSPTERLFCEPSP